MSAPRIVVTSVVLVVAVAAGAFFAGTRVGPDAGEFQPVVDAAEEIRARSAEPVSQDTLVRSAVRGMLDALDDPYAAFVGAGSASTVEELTSGSFVGIGVWVEAVPEGLRVASVLAGSPAERAGVLPGEVILRIDGMDAAGRSTEEGVSLLAGDEGSSVRLMIGGAEGQREVSVTRATIDVGEVQSRLIEGGVAYLRPLRFSRGVASRLNEEIQGPHRARCHGCGARSAWEPRRPDG